MSACGCACPCMCETQKVKAGERERGEKKEGRLRQQMRGMKSWLW